MEIKSLSAIYHYYIRFIKYKLNAVKLRSYTVA